MASEFAKSDAAALAWARAPEQVDLIKQGFNGGAPEALTVNAPRRRTASAFAGRDLRKHHNFGPLKDHLIREIRERR